MKKSEEIELKRRIQFLSQALSEANEMLQNIYGFLEDTVYNGTTEFEELGEYLNVNGERDEY